MMFVRVLLSLKFLFHVLFELSYICTSDANQPNWGHSGIRGFQQYFLK